MSFLNIFKSKKAEQKNIKTKNTINQKKQKNEKIATRKGELGEYKINIELDQLPKECKYISDIMIENKSSKSGYSQIDHVILTPYGIFVVETKNYQGTIYGGRQRKTWSVNGKFKMMNPFNQNYGHIQALKSYVDKQFHDYFISMVSFTKRSTFKVELDLRKVTSNDLIIYDLELSEFITRKIRSQDRIYKKPLFTQEDIDNIYRTLSEINITDLSKRKYHVNQIKSNSQGESSSSECVVCHKRVSEKVKTYCLTNKRFNGKIYCFDHQKTVK
ncbi:nuclease-related domain-containing protein [Salinibacillus xinjiangensis]|nr:nuclease-related domain-containing protein [Salinibacillus xinjiangensis]